MALKENRLFIRPINFLLIFSTSRFYEHYSIIKHQNSENFAFSIFFWNPILNSIEIDNKETSFIFRIKLMRNTFSLRL